MLDEQDGTVHFTHQTVKMFLLDDFSDQTNRDFHFKHQEADHYVGEIGVTYLNFNDFKNKLIRQPKPLLLPTPTTILGASLFAGPNSSSKSAWEKMARLRKYRSKHNLDSTYTFTGSALHNDSEAITELQMEHPFVSYAANYWLNHCANFKKTKTQTLHRWEKILFSGDGPAEIPWEYSEWSQRSRTIRHWICDQEHGALLSVTESSETPFSEAESRHQRQNS